MAEKLEVKIIAREVVKPSAPTPANLSRFNLSLLDQLSEDMFIPLLFFYSSKGNTDFSQTCGHLKSSLSETLSHFYPFAGRIKLDDPLSVDCSDDGVEFVTAQLNCSISHILGCSQPDFLKQLLPVDLDPPNRTGFLLTVQATFFNCGGLAIATCYSHKIADAAAFSTFIKGWTTIAMKSGPVEPPEMGLAALLPPVPEQEQERIIRIGKSDYVSRRFVFSASKMEELRARASSGAVDRPTRVEALTGLIWKCAATASRSVKGSSTGVSAAFSAVNLRKRLAPLVSENTMGNLVGVVLATSETSTDQIMNTSNMVAALRKGEEEFNKRLEAGRVGPGSAVSIVTSAISSATGQVLSMVDLDCSFSSWCRLPIYEADLGFGRPRWVTTIPMLKNIAVLMDSEDMNGVEVLVTLGEREMQLFEADQDLLSFASPTPVSV